MYLEGGRSLLPLINSSNYTPKICQEEFNDDLHFLQNINDRLLAFLFYDNNTVAVFPWELLNHDFQTHYDINYIPSIFIK